MRSDPTPYASSAPSGAASDVDRAARPGWRGEARLLALSCLAFICMALSSACSPHYQHVIERPLPATDDLVCPGYLVWNNEPVRHVFLVINGSGALSNAFVHPSLTGALHTQHMAYATYDKPGIRAPFGDPAALHRDYAALERYTLGHGIACATEALHWARQQFGPSVRLHIRAHSEGTLIALYAYEALLEQDVETAHAIGTLVLSGLALEPFGAILERQLTSAPAGAELRKALASCDWPVLRERMGISCAYVEDAKRRPSGRAMFERLATRAPRARWYVFQGTHDWNTPVEPIRALQVWNASAGHLDMQFHYYDGNHQGSDAVRAEVARLLTTIAAE